MNTSPFRPKKAHTLKVCVGLIFLSVISIVMWLNGLQSKDPIETEQMTERSSKKDTSTQHAQSTQLAMHTKPQAIQPQLTQTAPKLHDQQPSISKPRHLDFAPQYVPPIAKHNPPEESYQGDLNDLAAYQAFEHNQQTRIKQAYIRASKAKIDELAQWLNRGQAAQLSTEQLNEAKDKISALQALSNKLEQQLNQQPVAN